MEKREASRRGRIGGLVRATRYDGSALTAAALRGQLEKFARQVDPRGELPSAERYRRAIAARRAEMLRLAARSARARRLRSRSGRVQARLLAELGDE